MLCHDGINIGRSLPGCGTQVVGDTHLCVEVVIGVVPAAVTGCAEAVKFALHSVPATLSVDSPLLGEHPGRLYAQAQAHCVTVVSHVTTNTDTSEGNYVPYAGLAITAQHVAEVGHYLLVYQPVLVAVAVVVVHAHGLAPDALHLCTQTNAGSEPLTNSYGQTGVGAERPPGTTLVVVAMLCIVVECIPIHAQLDEPVAPEGISCHTVLLRGNSILGKAGERNTSEYH